MWRSHRWGSFREMARASNLTAELSMSAIPLLDQVAALAEQGCITGASDRNWAAYGNEVSLHSELSLPHQHILCDPQTSGGLLVSVRPEAVAEVLTVFHQAGFQSACVIGELVKPISTARVIVTL